MIDYFDGYVLSWTIGLSPNANLVNTMLNNVIKGLTCSMSKKGCSPDNSACEGFFGRLKNEFFYNRSWMNTTTNDFIKQLNDYTIWYNSKRIKESLGYMSPLDYRKSLGLSY